MEHGHVLSSVDQRSQITVQHNTHTQPFWFTFRFYMNELFRVRCSLVYGQWMSCCRLLRSRCPVIATIRHRHWHRHLLQSTSLYEMTTTSVWYKINWEIVRNAEVTHSLRILWFPLILGFDSSFLRLHPWRSRCYGFLTLFQFGFHLNFSQKWNRMWVLVRSDWYLLALDVQSNGMVWSVVSTTRMT